MRIWVTEIGEPLPVEKDVRLHRYGMMTREWARQGHDVVWWTSTFTHAKRVHVRDSDGEERVDGVLLKFLHGPGYQSSVSFRRIYHQAHFARRFAALAPTMAPPDVLISPVPTIEAARQAVRFGCKAGVPVVVDVRDEWPDEFVDLAPGPLRPIMRVVCTPWFSAMSQVCRRASGIVGVGRKFMDYGLRFAGRPAREDDAVIPFGYEEVQFSETERHAAIRYWRERGVRESAFVVCFFGTIGRFFDFDPVIEAARRLEKEHDVQFVICGSGSSLEAVKAKAGRGKSFLFPGWVNAPQIASLMEISRVGLAPYRHGARMSLPNKPIEYFAGGLPVVSSLPGELQSLLEERRCGYSYRADSAEEFGACLELLIRQPEVCAELGRNARKLFEDTFALSTVSRKMGLHLEGVIRRHGLRAGRVPATGQFQFADS